MGAGGVGAHPKGYAQYTNLSAVRKLSDAPTTGQPLSAKSGAVVADLQAENQDVRYTDDGTTTPTAAIGMIIPKGGPPIQYAGDLDDLQFIETAAGGKLNVSYYGL